MDKRANNMSEGLQTTLPKLMLALLRMADLKGMRVAKRSYTCCEEEVLASGANICSCTSSVTLCRAGPPNFGGSDFDF